MHDPFPHITKLENWLNMTVLGYRLRAKHDYAARLLNVRCVISWDAPTAYYYLSWTDNSTGWTVWTDESRTIRGLYKVSMHQIRHWASQYDFN